MPAVSPATEQAVTQLLGPTTPLVRLYERPGLPAWRLPRLLAATYGGDLGFQPPCTYANFVASLDDVAALGPEYGSSGSTISLHNPADRFVMGLLRACADTVLIGAGTLRATPGHLWTPAHVCPGAADAFSELRRSRRQAHEPRLAVATASGDLPTEHPALQRRTLILTTTEGARRLHGRIPSTCTVVDLGGQALLPTAELLAVIRSHGGEIVLSEAGPRLFG
jgi:riboflavin biosynthesis pyrimidine reductase